MGDPSGKPSIPGSRFGLGILVGALVSVIVVLATLLGVLITRRSDPDRGPVPSTTISPATSSPSPQDRDRFVEGEVKGIFNERHGWSRGRRLRFGVLWLSTNNPDCQVHTYQYQGVTRGAYRSGCDSWENTPPGYDILIFNVQLKNRSDRAVPFNLRNFVLTSRDGRSFGPVNVRSEAEFPPNFLPETAKLPPGAQLSGGLTFDGRVQNMIPASISYVDGAQTLTQILCGKPAVVA